MNAIDIVALVLLVFAAFRGFNKGLIIELASLLAFILGVYGAINFSDYVAVFIGDNWDIEQTYVPVVAFVVTFLIILITVMVLGKLLEGFINIMALKFVNKILGLVFASLRSLLVLSLLVFIIEMIDPSSRFLSQQYKDESLVYHPLRKTSQGLVALFSSRDWMEQLDKLKEEAPELI